MKHYVRTRILGIFVFILMMSVVAGSCGRQTPESLDSDDFKKRNTERIAEVPGVISNWKNYKMDHMVLWFDWDQLGNENMVNSVSSKSKISVCPEELIESKASAETTEETKQKASTKPETSTKSEGKTAPSTKPKESSKPETPTESTAPAPIKPEGPKEPTTPTKPEAPKGSTASTKPEVSTKPETSVDSPSSTSSPKDDINNNPDSSAPTETVHTHQWIEVTTENSIWVVDTPAYEEAVIEGRVICSCGADITNNIALHYADGCGGSYSVVPTQVGTISHAEVGHYEKQTVVSGYRCSSCGSTK